MKFLSCLFFAGPLLLTLAPTLPAQDKGKIEESPYYPLSVGTTWHYRVGDNKFYLKVTKHEKVGDAECAKVEIFIDGKPTSAEDIGITPEGICRFRYEGKDARPPICFLKLPPRKDETWKVDSKLEGQPLRGTFKSGTEKVKVPAGDYDTVTSSSQDLEANGMKIDVTYYFAEGVGMVKQVIKLADQTVVIELEKFEPAKG